MKLDFNFDGKTLLKKWWQQVKSNFQTVQDEYNALEDNLSEEINRRVNLGNDLTDKITKETSDRKTADRSLEGKISTETSDRKKADNSLEIKISNEVNSRQEADNELSGRIEYEKMERQADNEENKSRFFEKADKTELYGREKNITHKITHSLKKSDFIININAGNGNGTVTINSLPVQTKIFRDGRAYIQTAPISASFSAEKGEEGEKYINLLYSTETGKLDLEVTEQPEPGNFAKMDVTYMKATISEMYARRMYFDGLNTLTSLATKNKNSFLEAINELVASDTSINNSIGTIKKQLENTTITGIWHYGTLLTHTTNVNDVANNDIPANVGDFYLNSNTFSVYFCVGDDNGNHNWLYIGNLTGSFDYSNYASINSPHFEGIPTAPTPSASNNSTQIATTEYVRSAIYKYASNDNLEMIDLAEGLRDDVYGKQVVWTVGGNIMNLTLPAPKLTNPTTSEEVKITFDKGIIPFDNTVKRRYLPYDTTNVSFIPITGNKTYINCEFNFDTQHLEFTTSNSMISQNTIDAVETRVWKFSLCYYTVNVVYNDSSEEPASQYVISNYDCDWCINSEKIALPYQTLDMLKTVDKNCIINSINEVVDNVSKNQSEIGTLIYALHPDITTIKINGNSVVQNSYYGELITTDVNEIFVLDNQFDDFYSDYDKYDRDHKGHFLYTNDEVGYRPTKDILENKKAFCRILSKPSTGADSMDGEIEVLLTF